MAAAKDFYKTLGVAEGAPAAEIKKSYRKLAKKFHPDATGGDKTKESRFKEITEAYEVLGDEKKRANYDELRRNPFASGMPQGGWSSSSGAGVNLDINEILSRMRGEVNRERSARGRGGAPPTDGNGGFGDVFDMFGFGGGGGRAAPQRGDDVVAKLEIELPEAALGAEKMLQLDGKRLTVRIPAGVTSGKTIRVAGQGHPAGRGSSSGDLLIEIQERPHPRFRRAQPGSPDIEVEVPVALDVAILGGKAEVPTLEGPTVSLTVPPGSSSGRKLRLRGKGAYASKDRRGDLYATVSVQVPQGDLPERARELITEFAKLTRR